VGNHVKVKIVKNKVAPPFAEAEFDIIYNHGINKEGSILDVGIESGVVEKKGAWLQFEGELIGQGKDAAQKALAEKPELADKIVNAIMVRRNAAIPASLFRESGVFLGPAWRGASVLNAPGQQLSHLTWPAEARRALTALAQSQLFAQLFA